VTAGTAARSKCFDGDPALTKLQPSIDITESDIAAFADKMCRFFTRSSPFAFVSDPSKAEQRFIALWRGELFFGAINFDPCHLPELRDALIRALRGRRRVVSDFGAGQLMSPAMKAIYQNAPGAVSMGLDLPPRLKMALVTYWTSDRSNSSRSSADFPG
jgi:hypothetical protein